MEAFAPIVFVSVITRLSRSRLFFAVCFFSSQKNEKTADEDNEDTPVKTMENGATGDGVYNMSFSDDERFTQM